MTTFELTDDLLTFALRVDDRPMPASLQDAVATAVAAVGRPRAVGLLWLTDRWGSMARPASSGVRMALLVGLLILTVLLAAVYIGSRPPTEPNPTLPAVLVTSAPTHVPVTLPPPSLIPPNRAALFEEFIARVTDAKDAFGTVDDLFVAFVALDQPPFNPDRLQGLTAGYDSWKNATASWLTDEYNWLRTHPGDACFDGPRSEWATLRDNINAFYSAAIEGGPQVLTTRAADWSGLASQVDRFDPSVGATCVSGPPTPESTVETPATSAPPRMLTFDSPSYAYQIEYPSNLHVEPGKLACCGTRVGRFADAMYTQGMRFLLRETGSLADCSADMKTCKIVDGATYQVVDCHCSIDRSPTPDEELAWMAVQLADAETNCARGTSSRLDVQGSPYLMKEMICPASGGQFAEVATVANGVGYWFQFEGAFDQTFIDGLLSSFRAIPNFN